MFLVPYGRKNRGLSKGPQDIFSIDNLFDNFFGDSFMPAFFTEDKQIKVDIKENDKEYIVEADLPGVKKEEINVELNNDRLTISVARNEEVNEEKENYIRRERRSGSYCRSFYVENVTEDKISAKFENGVLSMILPKKEAGTKKKNQIEIQ
ncbi:MAG TPA: Hsp20/alpha crystallin family protein [Bacillota bacterium]|nr:Hsp20/alpha crystallin family protein [Bacillota bacterium]HOR86287.1 Hsp20/alpha crystallin family protein [Bacillota bacterium]HPL53622.1 Hsp20/alpha crystallin family protein [Bacillota bacterium]